MKNLFSLYLLSISLFSNFAWSQTTDELLKNKQESLEVQQEKVSEILDEIEDLKLQRLREVLEKYIPQDPQKYEIVTHSAMILSYNEKHEQANWVMHIIPKDVIVGTVTRTNDFRQDSSVSTGTANVDDYWESGYDRGHLAASADFRWSKKALSESYYYSNMSPQVPGLNRNAWSDLEAQVREWVVDYGDLIVITGPVLNDTLPKIPQGSHRVSIPTAFFKIIVDMNQVTPRAIAFLFPNKNVSYQPNKYVVTIDSIENLTGINFFPNLPDAETFESQSDLSKWKLSNTKLNQAPQVVYDLDHVPTRQAIYFLGKECNVCGKVIATRFNKSTKTQITYINFDEPYPNTPFTAVIFGKDRINFTYEPEVYLKDKMICVYGMVQTYKGKPQIIVNDEKQFSIYKTK
ncbi:MAG: DNA/RNA non-specific endonuclease [Chitinophagales bacterium]|nr:DNA/RNA non-specific endonuclease [Chitinophagales bacterium]